MNKNFSWPNDSKLAISMVVNVEEGAEENINDGDLRPDPVDELQVVMKKGRNYGNETNYQYGIKAGAPRILKLLSDFNIKATFTSAALALERAPKLAKAIVNNQHEICAHGYRWSHQHWMDQKTERAFIRKAKESIKQTCGKYPLGWLSRYVLTENTRKILIEEGYSYHMDDYSDDFPRWEIIEKGAIIISPYALDTNDMKMWIDPAFTPDNWCKYLIDTFDWLYEESNQTSPKIMSVGLHLRIAGRPGRMNALKKFLDHVKNRKGVWFGTRLEIAEAFAKQIPNPLK